MKFAKVVFWIAAIWGVLVLTPLYFIFDRIGITDPPAITHPGFYYGFVAIALVWQLGFMVIASDPVRLAPMMPIASLEKFGYTVTVFVLYSQTRMRAGDLVFAVVDFVLGCLFLVAFSRVRAGTKMA